MTSTPASASAPAPRRKWNSRWLQGVACGAVVTLATPTAVLAGALLAPGLVVLAVDGQPGRTVPGAVLMCGLAAAARPLALLWRGGNSIAGALDIAADPGVLATAWAAQTAGWLLAEIAPLAVKLVLDARAAAAAAVLRAARKKIEQEWDLPIRNPPAEQPPAGQTMPD